MTVKQYIAFKIRELREQRGLTQAELAAAFSAPKNTATISSWENGRTTPDADTLLELFDIFDVEANEFYPLSEKKVRHNYVERDRLVDVPLLSYFVGVESNVSYRAESHISVPEKLVVNHPKVYAYNLIYECMNKVCKSGCHVLIDPDKEPENDSVGVIKLDSHEVVIRRVFQGSSTVVLAPITYNPEHEDIILTGQELESIEFLGTVIWIQAAGEME